MAVRDVANGLVQKCRQGDFMGAIDSYYGDDIVSVESIETPQFAQEIRGKEAVRRKNQEWGESNEVHSVDVKGPYIGDSGFTVQYSWDITNKPSGQRMKMEEVAVYEVEGDHIVRERFFYNAPGQ